MNLHAAGRISALGAIVGNPKGLDSVALAANVFTLTLSEPIDATDAVVEVTPEGAAAAATGQCAAQITSDTTLEIQFEDDNNVNADLAFGFAVFRRGVGAGAGFGGQGDSLNGAIRIADDGTSTPATYGPRLGFSASARTGQGVYTATKSAPIDVTQSVALATVVGSNPHYIRATTSSDTNVDINVNDHASAAQDRTFDLVVLRTVGAAAPPLGQNDPLLAAGLLSSPGGVPAWGTSQVKGFTSTITDNGVGDYTVTLHPNSLIDKTDCVMLVTPYDGTDGNVCVEYLATDNTYRIRAFDSAGNADDCALNIAVLRTDIG